MAKATEEELSQLRKRCLSTDLSTKVRLSSIEELLFLNVEEGIDVVARLRDSLPFVSNKAYTDLLDLLDALVMCPCLNSHEKLIVVVSQYNQAALDRCYENFSKLVEAPSILLSHRVEACRYLFASEQPVYKKIAQQFLQQMVKTHDYPCPWRYRIVAEYGSKKGLGAVSNFAKLLVPFDEDFFYKLQHFFFSDERNGARERILSGQNLLEMKKVEGEERLAVERGLLAVADHADLADGIRADAADVLLRHGTAEARTQAQAVVAALGYAAVRETDRTVYSDRQNVHNSAIGESVRKFISQIAQDEEYVAEPFLSVYTEVNTLVRKTEIEPGLQAKCLRALDRISIDTATFTGFHMGIADVFCYVWNVIKNHPLYRSELETRLLQELSEMADTCSSGHTWRFVNVLSVYVSHILSISWEDQIKANIRGRMNARIRAIPDGSLKNLVALGALGGASETEAIAYRETVKNALIAIKTELKEEFVQQSYVPEADFLKFFEKGTEVYDVYNEKR